MPAQPAQNREPIPAGHAQIGNDDGRGGVRQVAPVGVSELQQEARAIARLQDEVAILPEGGRDHVTQLGERFVLARFHDFILSGGDMPLMLLERRVDDWIAAEKARA